MDKVMERMRRVKRVWDNYNGDHQAILDDWSEDHYSVMKLTCKYCNSPEDGVHLEGCNRAVPDPELDSKGNK